LLSGHPPGNGLDLSYVVGEVLRASFIPLCVCFERVDQLLFVLSHRTPPKDKRQANVASLNVYYINVQYPRPLQAEDVSVNVSVFALSGGLWCATVCGGVK
jgi:hypothetical protein